MYMCMLVIIPSIYHVLYRLYIYSNSIINCIILYMTYQYFKILHYIFLACIDLIDVYWHVPIASPF